MGLAVGIRVDGRYVVRRIHRGGMGIVLITEDEATGDRHAVKTVGDRFLNDRRVLDRFRTEARTWLSIEPHPNVVEAHFFRVLGGRPLLFLEYVDGVPLSRLLDLRRPIHLAQTVRWSQEIAAAMAHIHACCSNRARLGVVHRDLKPGNIMIRRDGTLKVMDFGLAMNGTTDAHLTKDGTLLGSPLYEAPEQFKDPRSVDHRVDIYAFGVILHEMLLGRRPFDSESLPNLIYRVLNDPPPDPAHLAPESPEALRTLIASCLAKDPGDRPACFDVIRGVLSGVAEGLEASPPAADLHRMCGDCRIWVPRELDGCLFDERDLPPGVRPIDPGADTVDWAPFADG
ncbi:MAG: serine/threonine protein kinase [Planctomycetes bacterium]|nr:serine/threonine protein kinase [Planctomycetota bacterium]